MSNKVKSITAEYENGNILTLQTRNETMPPDTEHTVFKEDWFASLPD